MGRKKCGVGTETQFPSGERKHDFLLGDGNVDEDLVIFVKTQQILLDALFHIIILFLLKKSVTARYIYDDVFSKLMLESFFLILHNCDIKKLDQFILCEM
jgi:hypothetical protein